MTLLETVLSATAIGLCVGAVTYTTYVVRRAPAFERPTNAQVRRMIERAPRAPDARPK